MAKNKLA